MAELHITSSDHGDHGQYTGRPADSEHFGWLSWVRHGNVRVAEHTVVPPAIGGRGIALELVEALVADARERGFKVDPQCSYVRMQFERHPDWSDLRAD
jgi:predicted GNAT family acetyltransferase